LVDENYDTGTIIRQCEVMVQNDDTVEALSKRVLAAEHELLVQTLQMIAEGRILLN
jgi:phosphoribosylglycinamide formyltransferase-1